jgi:hypothetical protein
MNMTTTHFIRSDEAVSGPDVIRETLIPHVE